MFSRQAKRVPLVAIAGCIACTADGASNTLHDASTSSGWAEVSSGAGPSSTTSNASGNDAGGASLDQSSASGDSEAPNAEAPDTSEWDAAKPDTERPATGSTPLDASIAELAGDAGSQAPFTRDAGSAEVELVLDPNGTTPLAAELSVGCLPACQVDVTVTGVDSWRLTSHDVQEIHTVAIVGLKPDEEYSVDVRANVDGRALTLTQPPALRVGSLPSPFPVVERLVHDETLTEPGWTLLDLGRTAAYLAMLDENAEFVWVYVSDDRDVSDARLLDDGHVLFFEGVDIVEMDLLGNEVRRLSSGDQMGYHHEVVWTDRDTFLTLGNEVHSMPAFPVDYDDLSRTADVEITDDLLLELSARGDELTRVRFVDILDPSRLAFDSLEDSARYGTPRDWAHANAIIPTDDGENVVISTRHQDAVFKVSRDGRELRWILANHSNWSTAFQPYLLRAVGDDFRWPYHQHAPQVTGEGNLMLFDNGVHRASPGDEIAPLDRAAARSRAVEYQIDESAMTVEQVWEFEPNPAVFSLVLGDADVLPTTNNVLMVYGSVDAESEGVPERRARLIEVARTAATGVVSDLVLRSPEPARGWVVYRAERIPNLR